MEVVFFLCVNVIESGGLGNISSTQDQLAVLEVTMIIQHEAMTDISDPLATANKTCIEMEPGKRVSLDRNCYSIVILCSSIIL